MYVSRQALKFVYDTYFEKLVSIGEDLKSLYDTVLAIEDPDIKAKLLVDLNHASKGLSNLAKHISKTGIEIIKNG